MHITVKQIFPTLDDLYKAFNTSTNGSICHEKFSILFPTLKNHKEKAKAIHYILEHITTWLYDYEPVINEIDIEAFLDAHKEAIFYVINESFENK